MQSPWQLVAHGMDLTVMLFFGGGGFVTYSVAKTSEGKLWPMGSFAVASDFKAAQFLLSNHTPNFPFGCFSAAK